MKDLSQLQELGQSIWLDYIRRSYLLDGGFAGHVRLGIRGVTSNPTIFEQAISAGSDYDAQIGPLSAAGIDGAAAFEELALRDIRMAASIMRGVYDGTEGADGFVSMEVSPSLAHDTEGTIAQALHLWERLSLPNIMIKVPGTPEGVHAIEELIFHGVNVNVTLLFSLRQHRAIAEAYIRGLQRRVEQSLPVKDIHSVASFFVSRVDTLVDGRLSELAEGSSDLLGKAAVANAKLSYRLFQDLFLGSSFSSLRAQGANVQRPLWASTSTKNPAYRDVLYVEELIGPHTVNTVPMKTLEAFLDHGVAEERVTRDVAAADAHVARLGELGIDLGEVGEVLQHEGVASFSKSYETLLAELEQKSRKLLPNPAVVLSLGDLAPAAAAAIEQLAAEDAPKRLLAHDVTLFPEGEHREVARTRMGWLVLPETMQAKLGELGQFTQDLGSLGIEEVILVGMGGSSLFPDLLRRVAAAPAIRLQVLDTTHPDSVRELLTHVNWTKTLAIMSSKSGTTREVDTLYRILRASADKALGQGAGNHFAAITDPGTPLAERARRDQFLHLFENPPDIGGRYSALSLFGLVPAAVIGYDIPALLFGAASVIQTLESPVYASGPAVLAAALHAADAAGRQKLVLPAGRSLPFADWLEQLIAESTGKEGRGILPAPGAAIGPDRLSAGFGQVPEAPSVSQGPLQTAERLGAAVALWECATALYGHLSDLDPFDQPNVSESKENTEAMLSGGSAIPKPDGTVQDMKQLVKSLEVPAYLAVQAYAPPSDDLWTALGELQSRLSGAHGCTVTVGVGPRFLHSTGQYHKGGRPYGAFLQLVAPYGEDVAVPDQPFTLGTLFFAQAAGDRRAIARRDRPLAALMLAPGDAATAVRQLLQELDS